MNSMLNRTLGKKVVRDSRFIAFGSPIDAKIMDIFSFGRGSPHWPQGAVNFFAIFQNWLEMSHFGRSYLDIWLADLGESMLVERSDSLLLGKNMKFGIYRLSPILGQWQCSMAYNPRRPCISEAGLWRL
jgi:hypothetical protein